MEFRSSPEQSTSENPHGVGKLEANDSGEIEVRQDKEFVDKNLLAFQAAKEDGSFGKLSQDMWVAFQNGNWIATGVSLDVIMEILNSGILDGHSAPLVRQIKD